MEHPGRNGGGVGRLKSAHFAPKTALSPPKPAAARRNDATGSRSPADARTVEDPLRGLYDLLGVDHGVAAVAAIPHATESRYLHLIDAIVAHPRMALHTP